MLSNSYPPVLGGLQTAAHHLSKGLRCNRHEVLVVTNRYPRSLPKKEVLDGVPIRRLLFLKPNSHHLRQFRLDLFLASFWFYPATFVELERLMKRFRPDIVNIHYPLSQIPYVLSLRQRCQFCLVVSLHGDDILPWVHGKRDSVPLRTILRQADAVTACSNWLLEQAATWEPAVRSKGVAIHNGIDRARFADQRSYTHHQPYFLAYGRLSYQKGFDLLLQAFARLASQYPKIDLILAGEGEEQSALLTLAQNAGLNGRVYFFGRAAPNELVQLLNGCSFLVIPSRRETFGIVALEAMTAAKRILATNVGGLPELLNRLGAHSVLVRPTVEDMSNGLREMLESPERQVFSAKDRNTTLSEFSWERVVARYEEVFEGRHDCGII